MPAVSLAAACRSACWRIPRGRRLVVAVGARLGAAIAWTIPRFGPWLLPFGRHRAGLGLSAYAGGRAVGRFVRSHRRGSCHQEGDGRRLAFTRARGMAVGSAVACDCLRPCVGGQCAAWDARRCCRSSGWRSTGDRHRHTVRPGDRAAGHGVLPDQRPRHARSNRRRAGRCGIVLRGGVVTPALFVAPVSARWSARAPGAVLRRLFALRLLPSASAPCCGLNWRLGKAAKLCLSRLCAGPGVRAQHASKTARFGRRR